MEFVRNSGVLTARRDLKGELRMVFSEIKEKFEDHLVAINQNTDELQSNYEFLCDLDSKMEKLGERIDQIEMFLEKYGLEPKKDQEFVVSKLTKREEEVFLVLYTLDGKHEKVTYSDIAKSTMLTEEIAMGYIENLIRKGVPIMRKHERNKTYLKINPHFRNLQAKQNILDLHQKTLL